MINVYATRCRFVAITKNMLLQLVAYLPQILTLCNCNSPQNPLQKHQFMFVRRVAKTLSYNPYFLRAVAGVRSLAPRGGREASPTPIGCDRHAPSLQMDADEREVELVKHNCKYQGTPEEPECQYCDGDEPCCVPCTLQFFCPMAKVPTATQQMHKVQMVNGKPQFYEPPEVAQARAKLLAAVCQHMPPKPLKGPVSLLVKWCFPVSGKHHDGEYRITKPDTDNLNKMLKDVMTQCGYWMDDAQVCREIVEKFWADTPGLFIQVEAL